MRKEYIGILPANIDKIYDVYCHEQSNTRKMELLLDTYENTIRYFGCIFLNEYLKRDFVDEKINNSIIALARPSLGIWMGFVDTYVKRTRKTSQGIEYIDNFGTVYSNLKKDDSFSSKIYTGRFSNIDANHPDVFTEIVMIRNNLAHGALYPDEQEAAEIVEHLDWYIDIILDKFADIFKNYRIEKCISIEEDDDEDIYHAHFKPVCKNIEYGTTHVIDVDDEDDVKKGALCLVSSDGRFHEMNEFLVQLTEEDSKESFYLYDGYGNRSVVYLGTREKHYIQRYFELVKKKFGNKKELSMKWNEGAFNMERFKDYVNRLTEFSVHIHKSSKKYNPKVYVERNIDSVVDEFMESDKTTLVVTAEAGVGKTNFLCHTAEKLSSKCAVYFFNGSDMVDVNISNQLFRKLQDNCLNENEFHSSEYFLAYINENNQVNKIPFVLIVDAVNEAYDIAEILKEIDNLTSLGNMYPWLKIIITIRTVSYNIFVDSIVEGMGKKFLLFSDKNRYYSVNGEDNTPQYNLEIDEWNILQVMDAYEKYCAANHMKSKGEEFLRLSSDAKKLLQNPLNMSLYFEVKKHNPDVTITSERDLFSEMYKSLKLNEELTKSTEQLQSDIVEMMINSQSNEVDYDKVLEASNSVTVEVHNDYRLLILPPFQRLIDAGVIYEKVSNKLKDSDSSIDSDNLRVFSFVYQKYLEYLLYVRIKSRNYDEFTIAEKMLESRKWNELPEAFMAYKNAIEDDFECITALKVITDTARRVGFDIQSLRTVYSEMMENLLIKTNDYTPELVEFIFENDLQDEAVALVNKIYTKEATVASVNLATELLKHRDKLSEKQIVELLFRMALAYQKTSDYSKALELLEECISIGDGDRTNIFYVEKSKTYRKMGENAIAKQILDDYFDDSDPTIPYIDLAWIQKGLCYRDIPDNERALEYYLMALPISKERGDNFNVIYNQLGISTIYVRMNEMEKARNVVEELCKNANRYGYINLLSDGMNAMANLAITSGHYKDGIRYARQGLTIWEESKYYVGQIRMHQHIIDAMVGLKRPFREIQVEIDAANKAIPLVKEIVILEEFWESVDKAKKAYGV